MVLQDQDPERLCGPPARKDDSGGNGPSCRRRALRRELQQEEDGVSSAATASCMRTRTFSFQSSDRFCSPDSLTNPLFPSRREKKLRVKRDVRALSQRPAGKLQMFTEKPKHLQDQCLLDSLSLAEGSGRTWQNLLVSESSSEEVQSGRTAAGSSD